MTKTVGIILLLLGATSIAFGAEPIEPSKIPEIDPGSLVSALTLASAALLMIRRRSTK